MENDVLNVENSENITEICELNDYLSAISEMRKAIRKDEGEDTDSKHFFFRGQASKNWDINPGIFRNNMLAHEAELIHSAFLRNPAEFRSLSSDFERLTKLQHYGLPTRLLDVTQNPLVALYFACQEDLVPSDKEGEETQLIPQDGTVVYQRAYCKGYDDLEVKVLAFLANLDMQGDLTLEQFLGELEGKGIYSTKAANECRKRDYNSLISSLQNNYFVISNLNNDRLIRQSGAFLICGRYNIILKTESIGDSLVQKANASVADEFDMHRFIIPAEKKLEILDELDFYNINEGSLFPELEHQMTYIKKVQSNRPAQTVGQFSRIESIDREYHSAAPSVITDEEVDKIAVDVVQKSVNKLLYDDCLVAIRNNMTIDWYRKEQTQSKMRVDLTDALAKTMDRATAKMTAQRIVAAIIKDIYKLSEDSIAK